MTSPSVDRLFGSNSSIAMKAPCRCGTTADITLSGLQTLDGITVVAEDRVLVKNQTDQTENGIYIADSGDWSRAPDFDGARDVAKGTLVRVAGGTTLADSYWAISTANPITIDTSNITFTQSNNSLAGVSVYGATLIAASTAAAARTVLGSSTVGDAVFVAATAVIARTALGTPSTAEAVLTAGSTMTGQLVLAAEPKAALQAVPLRDIAGYLNGCTISNNSGDATNDIDIAAGIAVDSTATTAIKVAAMTKQLDANWAAGSAAGMRNSAAAITNTTYHIYAVAKADGTQDIYAHTSTVVATVITALQAESGGSSYLYARRIGSIIRASAAIVTFVQTGDEFWLNTAVLDVNATNPGTAALTPTLSVPIGIRVKAIVNTQLLAVGAAGSAWLLSDPSLTDVAASTTVAPLGTAAASSSTAIVITTGGQAVCWTSTTGTIRTRAAVSDASTVTRLATLGWIDRRGRD